MAVLYFILFFTTFV